MKATKKDEPLDFTSPLRQVIFMVSVLILTGMGGYIIFPQLAPVVLANLYLNGLIFVVFLFGVVACFWQVAQLMSSISWLKRVAKNETDVAYSRTPGLLA